MPQYCLHGKRLLNLANQISNSQPTEVQPMSTNSNNEIRSGSDRGPSIESSRAADKMLTASMDTASGHSAIQIFNEMNAGGHKNPVCLPDLTLTDGSKPSTSPRPGSDSNSGPIVVPTEREEKK